MKELFKNFKSDKLTSGSGIAMILILVLRATGVDLGQVLGIDMQVIAEVIGAIFNAILLLVSKDPKPIAAEDKKA